MVWSSALLVSVDDYPMIGGISTYYRSIASELANLGKNICLYTHPSASADPLDRFPIFREADGDLTVVTNRTPLQRHRGICADLHQLCQSRKFDHVVILHAFHYGFPAVRAARSVGAPVWSFFHGFEVRSQLPVRTSWRQQLRTFRGGVPTSRESLEITMRSSKGIFAVSRYTAGLVQKIRSDRPIEIIGCGISKDRIEKEIGLTPNDAAEIKRARRISSGLGAEKTIVFVGRLVESKNVGCLIEVMAELSNHRAVIVGDGPERASLKKKVEILRLARRIEFVGTVSEERKWELLRMADYCMLLSKETEEGGVEGFGIALLEGAAAAALPVTVRVGGMPDAVSGGQAGLLCAKTDPVSIAAEIEALGEEKRIALISAARTQIVRKYNWTSIARCLADRLSTSKESR